MEDIFLFLVFFSRYGTAIQNQNPGCQIQTSSCASTHTPVLPCIPNAASQKSNTSSDALKFFEERNPTHSCPIAKIPVSSAGDV